MDFVYNQLKTLNSKKSSGLFDIPVQPLKDGAEALVGPLMLLMNRTINEGMLPADWKHAIVTPVHKAGSKWDPSNFRPILVLPVFSKIHLLELAVHRMVYNYLWEHRLLSPLQSGFHPLRHRLVLDFLARPTEIELFEVIQRGNLQNLAVMMLLTIDHNDLIAH